MRHTLKIAGKKIPKMDIFMLPVFFILFADSIMAYLFPVYLETALGSNIRMGLVMGLSSVAGLANDLVAPHLFSKRSWRTLIFYTILFSFLFPIFTFLGLTARQTLWFVVAALVWGIYFEFMSFSFQDYIISEEPKKYFTRDEGAIDALWQAATIVGPLVAAFILTKTPFIFLLTILLTQVVGFVLYLTLLPKSRDKLRPCETPHRTVSLRANITRLLNLIKPLFPFFFLTFLLSLVLSFYWTLGGLFGEEIQTALAPEWLFLTLFNVAGTVGAITAGRISPKRWKKHIIASVLLCCAGILLFLFLFTGKWPSALLALSGFSGLLVLMSYTFTFATFEEIGKREGIYEVYVLGVARIAVSAAYILGPIAAGILGDAAGYRNAFVVLGVFVCIIGAFLFLFSPRKLPNLKM